MDANKTILGIKIDVDTARGTKSGVPNLIEVFNRHDVKATFLFSLGPDNTGRAIKRIFKPGFFQKVSRTSVVSTYGLKTLLNGVFWPGPHIGRSYSSPMRDAYLGGHEVGIHTYDHIKWQDHLHEMTEADVRHEVTKAYKEFESVFGFQSLTAGAAGWQANKASLAAYDDMGYLYASDARGYSPFFPKVKMRTFKTLQIPTTLPTLDELLGRPEFPFEALHDYYLDHIKPDQLNVLTIHAELEGMKHLQWFEELIIKIQERGIQITPLRHIAEAALIHKKEIASCELIQGEVDGRSGLLAVQGS